MRTEEEIKKKLLHIQIGKNQAFRNEKDIAYVRYCRMEDLLNWVLNIKTKEK